MENEYSQYNREELLKIIEKQNLRIDVLNQMLNRQTEFLQKWNDNIIELLGTIVEYRDLESGEHIARVKIYTEIIGREVKDTLPEYGLTDKDLHIIAAASPLHDIGKIAIPDDIILKPGKLTQEEYDYMKSHTLSGVEILEMVKDAWPEEYQRYAMEISHYHHERYDGSGYPEGCVGDQIPISAQIVSIADAYDALVHERVYKDKIPRDRALRMIIYGECGTFNPKLIRCMEACREQLEKY
ncbi:MAG: HD-GYP domain-containing protein [Lachnospiraceae bacterium]